MKTLSREKSNTLLRTEVWTVRPDHIDRPFLLTVTLPENPPKDKALHGLVGLDGNGAAGTYFTAATYLQMEGLVPPAVVVSIGYPLDSPTYWGVARDQDLTPVPWPEWDATYGAIHQKQCPPSGESDAFLAFINDELKPEIERQCGVDRDQWTLVGHSLGGLFTTNALLADPGRFRRYLAFGSSYWWRRPLMFDRAEAFVKQTAPLDVSVYLAAGDHETTAKFEQAWAPMMDTEAMRNYLVVMGGIPDIVADTQRMAELLGQRPGVRVRCQVLENETHGSALFVALSQGLRWLNAGRAPEGSG